MNMTDKNIVDKIKEDELLRRIFEFAQKFACNLYLVGGAVRDLFEGKISLDRDLIIEGMTSKLFSEQLAEFLDATFIELDSENGIYRLVMRDKINFIDIADLIGDTLEDDLKRRDLTINSIAVNLKTFEIIDLNNGIKDFKKGIIRHISFENFLDDPLRFLRIFRFQAMLGFEIDKDLKDFVKKNGYLVKKSAQERITYELMKLFSGKFVDKALLEMDFCGLLEEILPIFKEVKKVPENSHHHLDLFHHSIETVRRVQILYEKSEKEVKEHLEKVDFGGFSRLAHLKLSAFLHDIGKPQTWTIIEGRHRFIKHDEIGSKLAIDILKDLKFSKKQIKYISLMIKNHIYPANVVSCENPTEKIFMRFVRKMQENSSDVILLSMADRLSARGVEITDKILNDNINGLKKLLKFYFETLEIQEPLPKLLDGKEIMKILNLSPCKKLGEIIEQLKEAQISGEILTKEDAINFVKNVTI